MSGRKLTLVFTGQTLRKFSTSSQRAEQKSYKLVVVGGGCGGCSTAAKFTSKLGPGKVAVIEPSETHYYQPLWTLVGAGIKKLEASFLPQKSVLPRECDWIKDRAVHFDPENCTVTVGSGDTIKYDFLVVAMGVQLNFNQIKGLPEALEMDPMVCSNYSEKTVVKTFPAIQRFKGGNAIFTFPNTPVKCAGAPQKIMYLAEDYMKRTGVRNKANIMYNSSLGVIFGVPKYAKSLHNICEERNIHRNFKRNLIEVRPEKREAVFQNLDSESGETETYQYDLMHVTPPMSAPDVLRNSPLADTAGWMDVNKNTLQHSKYKNVFGIGDCTNIPTSKTAAAVASQSGYLRLNLLAVMEGRDMDAEYNGYTSCPLVTSYGKCILAEFDFDGNPMETFPMDQGKERMSMYHMKKTVMPAIYWQFMVKGLWEGPATFRRIMRMGMGHITKPAHHQV